jgi:hypothetical protein
VAYEVIMTTRAFEDVRALGDVEKKQVADALGEELLFTDGSPQAQFWIRGAEPPTAARQLTCGHGVIFRVASREEVRRRRTRGRIQHGAVVYRVEIPPPRATTLHTLSVLRLPKVLRDR